jgi:hypothetical protein
VSRRSRPRCQSFSLTAAVSFLLRWFPLLRTIILWDDCAHLIPFLPFCHRRDLKSFSFKEQLCSAVLPALVVVVVTVFSCSVITEYYCASLNSNSPISLSLSRLPQVALRLGSFGCRLHRCTATASATPNRGPGSPNHQSRFLCSFIQCDAMLRSYLGFPRSDSTQLLTF